MRRCVHIYGYVTVWYSKSRGLEQVTSVIDKLNTVIHLEEPASIPGARQQ